MNIPTLPVGIPDDLRLRIPIPIGSIRVNTSVAVFNETTGESDGTFLESYDGTTWNLIENF